MVSVAGGIIITIVVLAVAAAVGWIVFTQYRARRLGLPTPSLSSYLPWNKRDNPYGPPQPAPGGVSGWFNDQVRKFKNRNNRSAAGAYEPSNRGANPAGPRGAHRALDPDEAWDTRVGNEADNYGYYEEELTARGGGGGGGRRTSTEYHGGSSYNMNLAATPKREREEHDVDLERGRQPSRSPGGGPRGNNPFDDDHAESLRGVSPRPMDHGQKSGSPSRHSVFKENV
ncbi:acid phosphatase-like protein [Beauveria brongniartii RCEF 3172]|uniref:Acid phosphatase-like protein n=1 Tax=Beauveria brongniartii RCEF 3172 TaxID=1081107 RepID=A0A167BBD4_9HYPO|nr:acid phosphatase-like protein [Beauveria brongniartii RCEF 3172]